MLACAALCVFCTEPGDGISCIVHACLYTVCMIFVCVTSVALLTAG